MSNDFAARMLSTAAEAVQSDAGLARYRLTTQAWLALLAHNPRSQVWQERSVTGIIDSVLVDHTSNTQWRLADDLAEHLARSHFHNLEGQRSYTVRYCESDLAFLQRLSAEEDGVLRFEPACDTSVPLADTPRAAGCPADVCRARRRHPFPPRRPHRARRRHPRLRR